MFSYFYRVPWLSSWTLATDSFTLHADFDEMWMDLKESHLDRALPWKINEHGMTGVHPRAGSDCSFSIDKVAIPFTSVLDPLVRDGGEKIPFVRVTPDNGSEIWYAARTLTISKHVSLEYSDTPPDSEAITGWAAGNIVPMRRRDEIASSVDPVRTKTTAPQPVAILKPRQLKGE